MLAGQIAIPIVFMGVAVGVAVLATLAGIQWWITGVIVGTGIAHSALRATSLDPLRSIQGSNENSLPPKQPATVAEVISISPDPDGPATRQGREAAEARS